MQQLTYSFEVFHQWEGMQGFLQHMFDQARDELDEHEEYDEEGDGGHDEEEPEENDEETDEGHDEEEHEENYEETDEGHECEVSAHGPPDGTLQKNLPPCFAVHTANNYRTYELSKKEQKEILAQGKVLTHLCNAFTTMPNIKRVFLTHSWRKPDQCWCEQMGTDAARRSHNPWPMLLPCTEEVCSFVKGHRRFCVKPGGPCENPDESIEWWNDLMLALKKTNKVLPELVMEVPRWNALPDVVSVSASVFNPSHSLSEIIPNIFSKLTRLELSLYLYHNDVNRALMDAKALETLHISIVSPDWEEISLYRDRSEFSNLLSGCTFPNLRSLGMDRCTADEEEILEFVRRSPDLRRLVLRRCRLKGHWVPLVQSLRDESNLRALELDFVLGPFDVDWRIGELDDNENFLGPQLQDFFYSEKHSPFPEEFIKNHVKLRDEIGEALGKWFDDIDVNDHAE